MEFLRMRVNVSWMSTPATLIVATALLAACGGGGGDSETATPTTTATTSAGAPIPTASPFAAEAQPTPEIVPATPTPAPTATPTPAAGSGDGTTTYTVEAGDSLYGIAARFDVSADAILQANGMSDGSLILIGQELTIPLPAAGGAGSAPEDSTEYTIEAGDSLFALAARFDTTVDAILDANDISDGSLIYVGRVLIIPAPAADGAAPAATPGPAGSTIKYTIEAGDSLFAIAARFDTTVDAILRENGIANPSLIYVGQVLDIPAP